MMYGLILWKRLGAIVKSAANYAMQPTPKPLHGLGTLAALGAADLRRSAAKTEVKHGVWHVARRGPDRRSAGP